MVEDIIKTPVGVNKNDLWKSYKSVVAQLKASEAGKLSTTTEVAHQRSTKKAVQAASSVNVTGLSEGVNQLLEKINGAKTTYDELEAAINAKKEELKNVHGIETEANTLVAIAETKEQLVETRTQQAEKILTEAKERAAALLQAAQEVDKEQTQQQQRKHQEWTYEFGRHQKTEEDTFQDVLDKRAKIASKREAAVQEREEQAGRLETLVERLGQDLEQQITQTQEQIDEASAAAAERAKKGANITFSMEKKGLEAQASIQNARIQTLEEQALDLTTRLEKAAILVEHANQKVTEMAQASLKAGADAATVAKLSEIAAGAGKK
jgi:chromosome segregation ATPase